ncbi:Uncharacterised protein [Mycobacteroides abscessus subsp. abscessus]|uniref:hypothetical protein n=1 Tax=Mycobacteroides abscessus TaxID=36809 RepID=UPI00092B3469|nr:hypothetical protein [Mycobacteroides abscessus]SHQ67145.1 Uncharacterised protein [Mycobacteroides abscessus subsp. abscessus]SHR91330.1 Uncharacterised protein [Mycobacteroides abscessus subsp. abscessus]SIH64444.1 Uncharacterised protein [Mycobacteroides abscessus subsp. abscessus]
MATADPSKLTAEDRQRILNELTAQQAQQRQQQVTELADLHAHITTLRVQLIAAEQAYRARHRHATTAGLLTATQLRTLGLPALPAAKAPASGTGTPSKSRTTRPAPAVPKPISEIMSNLPEPPTKKDTDQTPST